MALVLVWSLAPGHQVFLVGGSALSFGSTKNLSQDVFVSNFPTSLAVGGNVYVSWLNSTFTSNNDILFRASNDNGTNFGSVINLSNRPLRGDTGEQQIAGNGTFVYAVWLDNRTGSENVWFTASNNAGQSFNFILPKNLATITCTGCSSTRDSSDPQIAVSNNNVFVVWWEYTNTQATKYDVFYAVSTNNGATFTVINLSATSAANHPVIAAAGNDVYVAWRDSSSGANIFLKASATGGGTSSFGGNINLSNLASGSGLSTSLQQIAAVGSSVYVVWTRTTFPIPMDTFFTYSKNNGAVGNFSTPVNLSQNQASRNPKIAASGKNVYVAWANVTGTQQAAAIRASSNNGASFAPALFPSNNNGNAPNPQLAATGSNVYVAWQNQTSNHDVFFSSSNDNASTFSGPVNLSNDANSQTVIPTLAASGKYAYVAWQDDTPGNDEILFKAGTSAAPDVAISSMSRSQNFTYSGISLVNPIWINITVSNLGQVGANFVAIYLKANGTRIGNQNITNLAPQATQLLTFSFYKVSLARGNYTLTATANFTSPAEMNLSNNVLTCPGAPTGCNFPGLFNSTGLFQVRLGGDVNNDCISNVLDLTRVAIAFNSTPGSPGWNPYADLNNDHTINVTDLVDVAINFNNHC